VLLQKKRDSYNTSMRRANNTLEWNFTARCKHRYRSAHKKYWIPKVGIITQDTFWELYNKQQWICPLTGISLTLIDPNTWEWYMMYEVDHIIPCCHPDSFHGVENLQLVFPYSNWAKSNIHPV
jgi:hypothetical protein